jgi:hypothetical protein
MRRENAGRALDHHFAHVMLGLADQRDRAHRPLAAGEAAHPFGAAFGFAGAASADQQPRRPVPAALRARRRPLIIMRENLKALAEIVEITLL